MVILPRQDHDHRVVKAVWSPPMMKNLWKKMWSYKDHGKNFDSIYNKQHPPGFRWLHDSFGTNWRMMEMQAVIGRFTTPKMPEWTQVRNAHMRRVLASFENNPYFTVPMPPANYVHAAYKGLCTSEYSTTARRLVA